MPEKQNGPDKTRGDKMQFEKEHTKPQGEPPPGMRPGETRKPSQARDGKQ